MNGIVGAVGFLLVFGAVGGMEQPENSLIQLTALAVAGLGMMFWSTKGLENG